MRVLLLHNRYQLYGGEDTVFDSERELLMTHGHAVSTVEVSNAQIQGLVGTAQATLGIIYSRASNRRVAEAIATFRPDVAHVHNFFPLLSPSVYDACRAAGVPVVQTLHNYRLGCPSALLFRDGAVCEDCVGRTPWPGVQHGCYRGSQIQTAMVSAMLMAHRQRRTWQEKVDVYIALTAFQRDKMIQMGLPGERILVKPNFAPDPGERTSGPGDFALFVGRLAPEKGIRTVIEAYCNHHLTVPMRIVGGGPMLDDLQGMVRAHGLEETITFLGHRPKAEVFALMQKARFLVFPSAWYETFGMTIVEAFACGLPVMGSGIGGVGDLITVGQNGWLLPPNSPETWAQAIQDAWDRPSECELMGRAARAAYQMHYSLESAHRKLIAVYERAMTGNSLCNLAFRS